jgi:hypothetical protein
MKEIEIEPLSLLLELINAVGVSERFESPEFNAAQLMSLDRQYRNLLNARRNSENHRVKQLRSRSHFIKNLTSEEREKRESEYERLKSESTSASLKIQEFEKKHMRTMQDFKKALRKYQEAQKVIKSQICCVSVFTLFEIKDSEQVELFFLYPEDGMRNISFPFAKSDIQMISIESAVGKSCIGKKVGELVNIALPSGSLRRVVIDKISLPSEADLTAFHQEVIKSAPPKAVRSELDMRENRNHRDRHRTPY